MWQVHTGVLRADESHDMAAGQQQEEGEQEMHHCNEQGPDKGEQTEKMSLLWPTPCYIINWSPHNVPTMVRSELQAITVSVSQQLTLVERILPIMHCSY
jgi:hypothetical protein